MNKPQILIFDEATSALDAESEHMVQESIDNMTKLENKNNITIIVIAHRLSTIVNCSKIFVLQDGSLLEEGNHEELINKRGIYNTLV